jgi:iron complex outermembrane receptor protein
VQWFGNVARTYEPPSFAELTGGLVPVLNDAQRGTSVEFGTRGRTPQLQWDLVAYQVRLRGELLSIGGANGMGTTINAERTVHRGIEAGLGGPLGEPGVAFDWQLNALLNDFRFDGDTLYGNARLPGIPRGTLRAEFGWNVNPALRLALLAEAATDAGVDYAGTLFAPGYGLWGLRANGSLNVGGTLNWFVEGRNLGNKDYAATTGVIRNAQLPDAPLAQFFPGDGRAIYAGLDWRY